MTIIMQNKIQDKESISKRRRGSAKRKGAHMRCLHGSFLCGWSTRPQKRTKEKRLITEKTILLSLIIMRARTGRKYARATKDKAGDEGEEGRGGGRMWG